MSAWLVQSLALHSLPIPPLKAVYDNPGKCTHYKMCYEDISQRTAQPSRNNYSPNNACVWGFLLSSYRSGKLRGGQSAVDAGAGAEGWGCSLRMFRGGQSVVDAGAGAGAAAYATCDNYLHNAYPWRFLNLKIYCCLGSTLVSLYIHNVFQKHANHKMSFDD